MLYFLSFLCFLGFLCATSAGAPHQGLHLFARTQSGYLFPLVKTQFQALCLSVLVITVAFPEEGCPQGY